MKKTTYRVTFVQRKDSPEPTIEQLRSTLQLRFADLLSVDIDEEGIHVPNIHYKDQMDGVHGVAVIDVVEAAGLDPDEADYSSCVMALEDAYHDSDCIGVDGDDLDYYYAKVVEALR